MDREMHRPSLAAFPVPHSLKPKSHISDNFPNSEAEEQARTTGFHKESSVLIHPKVVTSGQELKLQHKSGSQVDWALEELIRAVPQLPFPTNLSVVCPSHLSSF